MARELLLSLTKKDFEVQTFRAGGKGGQKQNKTDSGVRIIHAASGARGECRNNRQQSLNKQEAFDRLIDSPKFKIWLNRKLVEINTGATAEKRVDEMMESSNLKIEHKENNKWVDSNENAN